MAAVFGTIAGISAWRGHAVWIYWTGTAAIFLAPALLFPSVLKPVQKVWMTLTLLIGWVMSRVLLTVVFFLAITPIAIFFEMFRKRSAGFENGET